jgi:signal transduction histidine kinase/CheY-like chemotaxis protein/HPt (histidine-containing phosphotransfer) domain-containing protein
MAKMEPSLLGGSGATLGLAGHADIRRNANEALARQSVTSIYGHWLLAAIVLSTASFSRAHPTSAAFASVWIGVVGVARLAVAKSFAQMWATRPRLWVLLFRGGLLLSSATWGLGGAVLLAKSYFDRESWLVLLSIAGISTGAIASTSRDLLLTRLHILVVLLPVLIAGALFMPGTTRLVTAFTIVIGAYAMFLWVQAGHAHAAFLGSLVKARLLELKAVELDAARRESLEANRAKSAFLANMSHEIRTPMAAVIGYADLLLDPVIGPSDRVNCVQTIRRNAEHLMSIVNDILDISKIEAGKMTVENISTSPNQVLVEVASLMRVRAVEKSLTLDIQYQGAIPETIQSDPTRLKQILLNLVGNAIKFTETGQVRIEVRCDAPESNAPCLTIDVLDTGIGMTEEELQKVFATFTQGDASTTRRFGGSGLGLTISKRLAVMLGGDITAESSPGRGSRFRVSVPTGSLTGVKMVEGRAEAGIIEQRAPAARPAPNLLASCRVLLAEDGHDNQVLIKTFLVSAGATVTIVPDGQQAVQEANGALLAGKSYDVILMDMQMPVLDGYGATSKLRQTGYRGPIVAITAHAMAGDRERCEAAGCDDYLSKPVDRMKLTATVARFKPRAPASDEALVSTLSDDEDMREIVREFVRDLPDRSAAILRASQASDYETLERMAHQLKGAAGGYGFPRITEAAAAVERAVSEGLDLASLQSHAETLANLCRRARAL